VLHFTKGIVRIDFSCCGFAGFSPAIFITVVEWGERAGKWFSDKKVEDSQFEIV
jgi:hypothetical protein